MDAQADQCILDLGADATLAQVHECEELGHGNHVLKCITNEEVEILLGSNHCLDIVESVMCPPNATDLSQCSTGFQRIPVRDDAGNLICWAFLATAFGHAKTVAKGVVKTCTAVLGVNEAFEAGYHIAKKNYLEGMSKGVSAAFTLSGFWDP